MASPLEQAGAVREPSEYAALTMDRAITGLWTQRSPLRDADVPYLYGKFYGASRFDSLLDGINREVTARLTYQRRAGSSPYNTNLFPAANSFYSYKRISSGSEVVRVLLDGVDGVIYDATAGQKSTVFTKSAGAGKARFQGINTALYFSDGVENKKWLQPSPWVAQLTEAVTQYAIGTTILDSNGKLEYLASFGVGTVINVAVTNNVAILKFDSAFFNVTQSMSFTMAGLTGASFLNGNLLFAQSVVPSGSDFIVTAQFVHINYAAASDSAEATTTDVGTLALTGPTQPVWATGVGASTTDNFSTWVNYGVPVYDWGPPAAPPQAPTIADPNDSLMTFWQPLDIVNNRVPNRILDSNGFIQTAAGAGATGGTLPEFQSPYLTEQVVYYNSGANSALISLPAAGVTQDGGITWYGAFWLGSLAAVQVPTVSEAVYVVLPGPQPWKAATTPVFITGGNEPGDCCVDSNGNLQQIISGSGATGGSAPAWATGYGSSTTDSGLTWKNLGPYLAIAFQGRLYGYAYHCVDGSVSTLSPLSPSTNAVLESVLVGGVGSSNPTCDSIWIFHTADGQSSPLFLAQIPNPGGGVAWTFNDYYADSNLIPELVGPQGEQNNPPPLGATAPFYHLGRMWLIYQNTVICSGGPNVLVGNGNTSFAPLSSFPIPEQPIRLTATITSEGPALLIWGRANRYIILGAGTPSSPFQSAALYAAGGGILSYDALCQRGSTFYTFGATSLVGGNLVGKVLSMDPGAGEVELGFPIGDQFENVTTGAGGQNPNVNVPLGYLYNPANTFVTWAELGSGDTALYVSDGSVGWFRCSPVTSPETGFLWSPRAALVAGTSAVQCLETQPGVWQLLIGPSGTIVGEGTLANNVLTWTGGPQFNSGMVGGTITLIASTGSTSCAVTGFVSATELHLGVTFPPTPIAVSWSIPQNGPILFRDSTVNGDYYGSGYVAYPSYDVKGCIQLCLSGEVGEIAHVHVVSQPQGARPQIGLLFGEILPTAAAPFSWYSRTCSEPPNLPESQSCYSDRYTMLSKGVTPKCLFFQLGMDYGTQNYPDELLMFSVYGAKYAERKQQ
jgi:hypothetical protein